MQQLQHTQKKLAKQTHYNWMQLMQLLHRAYPRPQTSLSAHFHFWKQAQRYHRLSVKVPTFSTFRPNCLPSLLGHIWYSLMCVKHVCIFQVLDWHACFKYSIPVFLSQKMYDFLVSKNDQRAMLSSQFHCKKYFHKCSVHGAFCQDPVQSTFPRRWIPLPPQNWAGARELVLCSIETSRWISHQPGLNLHLPALFYFCCLTAVSGISL